MPSGQRVVRHIIKPRIGPTCKISKTALESTKWALYQSFKNGKHQATNNTTERKYAPKPKLSTRVGQYKKENFYLIYNWVTTR
jgi:hypothetical protein